VVALLLVGCAVPGAPLVECAWESHLLLLFQLVLAQRVLLLLMLLKETRRTRLVARECNKVLVYHLLELGCPGRQLRLVFNLTNVTKGGGSYTPGQGCRSQSWEAGDWLLEVKGMVLGRVLAVASLAQTSADAVYLCD